MLINLTIILLVLLGLYFIRMGQVANALSRSQQWSFLAKFTLGLLAALPVFIPSPDFLGPDHRFTVSMGQMLVALDLAPVLLFSGVPPIMLRPFLHWHRFGFIAQRPFLAGIASTLLIAIWFIPFFFSAASGNLTFWLIKQGMFFVSGLVFWWPLIGPFPAARPTYPLQIAYILVMRIPMAALGIGFTFAEKLLYLSRSFALEICAPSSISDQQTGGLMILFVGGTILLIAFIVIFFRWFAAEEAKDLKG